MTGFDSKRRIALDRLDDDDIQVYAQPNLKGESMTNDEALTLEALKYAASMGHGRMVREMKIAPFTIKEAQAQPVQEPVATMKMLHTYGDTTPPERPWVGLTDEEWSDLYEAHHDKYNQPKQGGLDGLDYERAIEAALRSKNI